MGEMMKNIETIPPERLRAVLMQSLLSIYACTGGRQKHVKYTQLTGARDYLLQCTACGKVFRWPTLKA